MLEELKVRVFQETMKLVKYGLVGLTRGNVSGIDQEKGLMVITPSGVPYEEMKAEDMVVVDMIDGRVAEGGKPSGDTPTHLHLYRTFPELGGIVHIHSLNATVWAQAGKGIPPYGVIHADAFCGEIPCTRGLTEKECKNSYELNVGKLIEETFNQRDYIEIPGVLVKSHGAVTWGDCVERAAENAMALEAAAEIAIKMKSIDSVVSEIEAFLLEKRYMKKHGKRTNRNSRK